MGNRINFIKNYNQILLALAGTVGLITLIVSCILILSEIKPRKKVEDGMIATEETKTLVKQNLREKLITINEPQLIDSTTGTYIIPISQANLNNIESEDKSLGLRNKKFSGSYGDDQAINNLVLYHKKSDKTSIVFGHRLRINGYIPIKKDNELFLLIRGCEIDTNEDKFLNSEDLQKLYLYDLREQQVKAIDMPDNYSCLGLYKYNRMSKFDFDYLSNNIYQFGVDRNNDGTYDRKNELQLPMVIDIDNQKINAIVTNDQVEKLQNNLEGK